MTGPIIPCTMFAGQTVAVMGLARSGLAAARALAAGGARVWAWDDDGGARKNSAVAGLPPTDLHAADWSQPKALVLSPGIAHTHPKPHAIAAKARQAGCPIIGDIELLFRACPAASYVGVTGTNGKSTTTALIAHILRQAGRRVEVGGNLGTAALALAPLGHGDIYVLEMSSYQLELTPGAAFAVAVLLNITPDHLERHGGFDGYVAAKRRIFAGQPENATAVIGIDDQPSRALWTALAVDPRRRAIPISARVAMPGGVSGAGGTLTDDRGAARTTVMNLRLARHLPGEHNWQNAAAAYAATRALGLPPATIATGIASYPGLPHRQETIATIAGVTYVNDSKATNADATAKALACYDTIYWIVGGRPKEGGIGGTEPYYPRIVHAFLIGEAEEAFAATLKGQVVFTRCGTIEAALHQASTMAERDRRPGAVVLLSPACASFDQFANFEVRGDSFRRLVQALDAPGNGNGAAGASARRATS